MIRNKKRQDLTNTAQIIFAHIRESNSAEYNIYSIRNENVIHSFNINPIHNYCSFNESL